MEKENTQKNNSSENNGEARALKPEAVSRFRLGGLKPAPGSVRRKKRLGSGRGSGRGKTCGRGHKGQKARSRPPAFGFEGGQMPLIRRIPKRGFTNINTRRYQIVDLGKLEIFSEGEFVGPAEMAGRGLLKKAGGPVKILGGGKISKPLKIEADSFSKTAIEKIEAAGGEFKKC